MRAIILVLFLGSYFTANSQNIEKKVDSIISVATAEENISSKLELYIEATKLSHRNYLIPQEEQSLIELIDFA